MYLLLPNFQVDFRQRDMPSTRGKTPATRGTTTGECIRATTDNTTSTTDNNTSTRGNTTQQESTPATGGIVVWTGDNTKAEDRK